MSENNRKKVGIVAECVCDLPKSIVESHENISMVYFLIETDTGIFTDSDEISTENIISYILEGGKKSRSSAPSPDVYKKIFAEKLGEYDELIHVAISDGISDSCKNSRAAVNELGEDGKRVHIFDSRTLSSSLGLMVLAASEMAESGSSAAEILSELERMKDKVSTTFITESVEFLYRNGRVSKTAKALCDIMKIRPVLMMKNGKLSLKSFIVGKYEYAYRKYVKKQLRTDIDCKRLFLVHVGCSAKTLDRIKQEVSKKLTFEEIIVAKASATVASNCGPNSFGVMFIRK